MTDCVLGIDVGTGGVKSLLLDGDGTVLATAFIPHPLSTPRPRWSEQNPEDWWTGAVAAIRTVLERASVDPAAVRAIGLTGQMHGLVLLDEQDRVLRPAILWNDQRTDEECRQIHELVGEAEVVRVTGKPVLTGFTAPKILWVRRHEPEVFARARHVLLPKDFVRQRLTGVYATDVADASGTSLLDLHTRTWSDAILAALEIPAAWMPAVAESPEVTAHVDADAAARTGIPAGTPVVSGAGDQAAEAIGCGVTTPGPVSVTIGTSGVVFAASATPPVDPAGRLHGFCHAVPGLWHVMGVMLSAGGSLRWFRDTLAGDLVRRADAESVDPYELIIADAAARPAGSEGLLFLPYLTGERTPHPDPHARGAFVGLTLRHDRGHLGRAVLEGVAYGLRDGLEIIRSLGLPVERVRCSGGGARSATWRQILADVFDADVGTVNVSEGAAFGAAILAAVGAGFHPSVVDAAAAIVREGPITSPGGDRAVYERGYPRYRALYPALADSFRDTFADSGE